jgi:hypothetical protein
MLEGTELGTNPGYTMTMKSLKSIEDNSKEVSRKVIQEMVEQIW